MLFAQCIFGRDFLSPRTTMVLGIENYPSACMSCCSALLLAIRLFQPFIGHLSCMPLCM